MPNHNKEVALDFLNDALKALDNKDIEEAKEQILHAHVIITTLL